MSFLLVVLVPALFGALFTLTMTYTEAPLIQNRPHVVFTALVFAVGFLATAVVGVETVHSFKIQSEAAQVVIWFTIACIFTLASFLTHLTFHQAGK